jgi:hypothetical protein
MKPRGTATAKPFCHTSNARPWLPSAISTISWHVATLFLLQATSKTEFGRTSRPPWYFASGEAADVLAQLAVISPLLPNSLILRSFGGFDVLRAGSKVLLKPKTQQTSHLAGCRFKHQTFRARWLRRSPLTQPVLARSDWRAEAGMHPWNLDTGAPRLAGGSGALSQNSSSFSQACDLRPKAPYRHIAKMLNYWNETPPWSI